MLKVKDLIQHLKNFNPEANVVVAKDAEGNDHSPLSTADTGLYAATSSWSGDVYQLDDVDELRADGWSDDAIDELDPVVILRPVN